MNVYLLLMVACVSVWTLPARAQRVVAVTVDDLPYAGGSAPVELITEVTHRILGAFEQYDVPASGFVTGINTIIDGQIDARFDLLRRWREAGAKLENHGYSHLSYQKVAARVYLDDVIRGHEVAERIMRERGDSVRFYRPPFNHTGPTAGARDSLVAFLAERGVRLAPFTIEHADYAFDALYADALARGNPDFAARVGTAYLAQLDSAFSFAERVSLETFGREIPQVFLIHANRINADYLPDMLERLRARGYTFIPLEDAVQDEAYHTPDGYAGPWGISWLHRWRIALGLPNRRRSEPDPPAWVLEAYDALAGSAR